MENKKLNIAELLKNCPSGLELNCTMYEDLYFDYVDELNNIRCYIQQKFNKTSVVFNQDGTPNSHTKSKCVIFPKGKTTWEGFVPPCKFKDGDVLFVDCSDDEEDKSYQYIFILNKPEFLGKWHSYCMLDGVGNFQPHETYLTDEEYHSRFATEEEKAKLFDAIKENGYKWNPETKTLEKLPKFKVGDIIQDITGICKVKITEVNVEDKCYLYKSLNINGIGGITFNRQDDWELAPDKFDITTLKPFKSEVLVRDNKLQKWSPAMWGYYDFDSQDYPYKLVGGAARYCIPYEKNEHLLGTTDDCDDFYKNW